MAPALLRYFSMHSIVWWSTVTLVLVATITDIRWRRIPNWLVLPFLAAGVLASVVGSGFVGLRRSLGGIAVATVVLGVLCWLRGMGMGDLKLCAAVGAWIGSSQLSMALLVTAIAGGVMALVWASLHGSISRSFDGAGDLVFGLHTRGIKPHPTLVLTNPSAQSMPYAPAIAIGTIFSFFTS